MEGSGENGKGLKCSSILVLWVSHQKIVIKMLRLREAEGRREREGGRMGKEKEQGRRGRKEERGRKGGMVEGRKRKRRKRREREKCGEVSRGLKEAGRVYSLFQK